MNEYTCIHPTEFCRVGDEISEATYYRLHPEDRRNFKLKIQSNKRESDIIDTAIDVGIDLAIGSALSNLFDSSDNSQNSGSSFDGFDGGDFGGSGASSDY